MMFVRTPMQFYIARFLLGAAEAGFFPGVVHYLALVSSGSTRTGDQPLLFLRSAFIDHHGPCIPAPARAPRAWWTERMAMVVPRGRSSGHARRDRDFPAASGLADSRRWLNPRQAGWIEQELAADARRMPATGSDSLAAALAHPATLRFGLLGFLSIGAIVTYSLSAPLMLRAAGFSSGQIGTLVAVGGLLGAGGMLLTGWISDRRGERFTTMWICATLMGISFAITAAAPPPAVLAAAYLLYGASWGSLHLSQVSAWPDVLQGRVLALACAAINTLSQIGAFFLPILWGRLADSTGSFRVGLIGLTGATAITLLLILELGAQVRRTTAHA